MGIPMRMNPVPIRIKQFQGTAMVTAGRIDPDFDEPQAGQNKVYGTEVEVEGQIVYNKKDAQEVALTGDPGSTAGHLTFRRSDLDAKSIILGKGDIVTFVESFPVNYKITEVRPTGHLRGKANLIMAFFGANDETNPATRR